jgi:hypothetical protein
MKENLAKPSQTDQWLSAAIAYGFEGDFSRSVTRSHLTG